MDDDFEISEALAALFEFIREINSLGKSDSLFPEEYAAILQILKDFDQVLAVIKPEAALLNQDVETLIAERNEARENKDFKRADEIRNELEKQGILLEDNAAGTVWKRSL